LPANYPTVSNRLQSTPTTVSRTGNALVLSIIPPPSWPSQVFDVRDQYDANVTAVVVAAVATVGGVVYLSGGPCVCVGNDEKLNLRVSRALSYVAHIRNCQNGSSYSKGEVFFFL